MQYHFVKLLSWLVCWLPRRWRKNIGDFIGKLCWPLVPRRRREMAINNVIMALKVTRNEAEAIVKKSAVRFGRMFMEVLHFPKLNANNINDYVTLQGKEYLEEAFSYGKGVVMPTAHAGNWELLGAALAMNGFPLVAVVQKQTNQAMDKFINEYRTKVGMHVTYKTGVREMVALLSEGKAIGLLMDQDAKEQGAFVEFFGKLASAPQGAAALARLKDAPIVAAFITENENGTHTAILHPPVWVAKTKDRDKDLLVTTQELTTIIERHIRTYPSEWFWLHNRWKTRPPKNNDNVDAGLME